MSLRAHQLPSKSTCPPLAHRPGAFRFLVRLSISISLLAILIIATELISIAVLSVSEVGAKPANTLQSYYQNQPWAADFWKEQSLASPTHYSPFVIWRRAPFKGKYVNVEPDGLRRTVNPDCSPGARQIWIFGSSSLWGTGATDDLTIPSILSQEYSRSIGPVCVTNFSEAGWMSTQNIIQLELALKRAPRPPDLVLFDDGYADVFVAWESGRVDVHMDYERIQQMFEAGARERSALAYLKESATYRFITAIMNKVARLKPARTEPTRRPARNLDSLAEITVDNYLKNMKLVESLSRGYGFQYTAFWGPVLFVGKKSLSGPERRILDSAKAQNHNLPELSRKTYVLMFSTSHPHMVDISDALDLTADDIYLDVSHVTPVGNRLIALRMLEAIRNSPSQPIGTR